MPRKSTATRRTCPVCGTEFVVYPSTTARPGHGQWCSRKCRYGGSTLSERFWQHVTKSDGCWTFSNGGGWYGAISTVIDGKKKILKAHRVSWELHNGPVPAGMFVCHSCDNPSCVRPDHLWLGTHSNNMKDAMRKGRMKGVFTKGHKKAFRNGEYIGRWRNHKNLI